MYTARKRLKLFHKSLCQYISHCDLLTHLDISDTVSKSKLYNLLEAISETHDAMNDQGSADGYDVESVHLSVFFFQSVNRGQELSDQNEPKVNQS